MDRYVLTYFKSSAKEMPKNSVLDSHLSDLSKQVISPQSDSAKKKRYLAGELLREWRNSSTDPTGNHFSASINIVARNWQSFVESCELELAEFQRLKRHFAGTSRMVTSSPRMDQIMADTQTSLCLPLRARMK